MTSAILSIYDAFVAAPITVGTTTFTAKDADAQPNSLVTAGLPLRLLGPIELTGRENTTALPIYVLQDTSYAMQATWRIFDNMFYRPLAQGIGQQTANAVLLGYMADYLAMLADTTRLILPADCWVVDVTMSAEVLEYPLVSGNFYFGVRCIVTVAELLN